MSQHSAQTPLHQLLQDCCTPRSPRHASAWKEFMQRYRPAMENAIKKRCHFWDAKERLPMQLKDVVNDILGQMVEQLFDNDFRTLKIFRHPDNELRFYAYLITISTNAASAYLRKAKYDRMTSDEALDWQHGPVSAEGDLDWEVYEARIAELRAIRKQRKTGNLERDIHIFFLYRWADFDQKMILRHPYLGNIGDRVVDLVANRLGDRLKQGYSNPPD